MITHRNSIINRISALMLTVLAVLMIASCRSSKTATLPTGAEWTSVYMPVKVALTKPTAFSLSGRATIERNRGIDVSMRFLGMEVASMTLVNDSVFVLDRYHKYAFAEPLRSVLGSRYDKYTVADIISILFGQQKIDENRFVTVTCSDMTESPAGTVAQRIDIDSNTQSGRFAGSVELKFNEAEWNTGRTVRDPSIPKKYTRIDLETLRKVLKSFKI